VFTTLAILGVYWAVCAQDRPSVIPPEPAKKGTEKPPPLKFPSQTQPLAKKKKPDPTLIIPPEVFDLPRPITAPVEIKPPEVVQTGGQLPPPSFPPIAPGVEKKEPLPPLPPIADTKPVVIPPLPMPEPTKALIVDPPLKDMDKKSPLPPLPMPLETPKNENVELPIPAPAKPFSIDPPGNASEKKGVELPAPPEMLTAPKKAPIAPPTVVVPPPKQDIPFTQPATMVEQPAIEKIKSFVRIRPTTSAPTPLPPPAQQPTIEKIVPKGIGPLSPPPAFNLNPDALANLQTPAVVVEKRGPQLLRAGETQDYQLVVRNLGTTAAQQIRVDDDLPPDVRIVSADPTPNLQGTRASWMLTALSPQGEQTLRLKLRAEANVQVANSVSVHVSATSVTTRAAAAPASGSISMRLSGPDSVSIGKQAVFEIHVSNQTSQRLNGIVLYGTLPEGLTTPAGDKIEGEVSETIAPGEFKILKMPTTAIKAGRHTVHAKVITQQGEASATTTIEIAAEALLLQQAPMTRLTPGRDGNVRIDLSNQTGKPLRNVQVASLLPEGITFIGASERGLYQSNSRTVHWLIDHLPNGGSKELHVRVAAGKAGQHQSIISARADGVAEVRSGGAITVEGSSDLSLRVIDRDNPLELGRETVYEIHVQNPGSAPANNVRVQVQFPAGWLPKSVPGNARFTLENKGIAFEPIVSLPPQGQAVLRIAAQSQAAGKDQRLQFSVVSDEVRTPVQRELSVLVYSGN